MAPREQHPPGQSGSSVREFFQHDHVEIDALFAAVRREIRVCAEANKPASSTIVSQFEEFDRRLEKHIHWEEDLLFPEVERVSPELRDGPGDDMRREHQDIRRFKDAARKELERAMADPQALPRSAEALDRMREILEVHNMKEEQVYYPMADEMLAPALASDLLKKVRTF